jgi:uncharacterized damage-inducible protein DinB
MISPHHARLMAAYNRWMNGRVYELSSRLPDEERKHDMGAFFKSIHGTLNHLLLADHIWLGRFLGKPYPARSLDQELHSDFAELRSAREALDETIARWIASLTEADLAREMSYMTLANPQPRRHPVWIGLTHLFNHQTHHRGQLTTLLSQRGMDPGVTDLIWLPEVRGRPMQAPA